MANKPFMQLYVADYMADTAHLSTLEHGAYLLLIMAYWQSGKPLLSHSERLANAARMSIERWCEIEATIREFFDDTGTHWRHKRVDAELEKFRDKSEKARESALTRNKSSTKSSLSDSERSANAQRTLSERSAITDNRQQITDNRKQKKREYAPSVLFTEEEYQKIVAQFGEVGAKDRIERLSLYKESSGKKYKSDYATILSWARKDKEGGSNGGGKNRSGDHGAPTRTDGTPKEFWA